VSENSPIKVTGNKTEAAKVGLELKFLNKSSHKCLVRDKCAVNKVRRYVNRGRECFKRSLGTQSKQI